MKEVRGEFIYYKPGEYGSLADEAASFEEFKRKASAFFTTDINGSMTFIGNDGLILKYSPASNTFGAANMKKGIIQTLYKPDGNGAKYFQEQVDKYILNKTLK